MDEDELIMIEVQSKMVEMLIEYQEHGLQALGMAMKTILDTYVVALGEEDTVKLLETAIKTVKEGKHSHILDKIPKNLLNFNLSWSNESGSYANLDTTFTGKFYADNGNQNKVNSYRVSNLRLGKNFIRNDLDIGFYLGVNNIFNEKYNSNIRINAYGNRYFEPAPKQNVFFGITVNKKFPG